MDCKTCLEGRGGATRKKGRGNEEEGEGQRGGRGGVFSVFATFQNKTLVKVNY